MADKYSESDLIQGINNNFDFVKNIAVEQADKCAGSIRSILEYAVKLFWLKKHNLKPVWVKGYVESFDLHKAITDERFSQFFNKLVLADMHAIRQTCNGVLHDNDLLTLEDAQDLLNRLEKCVKAIEKAISMKILVAATQEPTKDPDMAPNIGKTTAGNFNKIEHKTTNFSNIDAERNFFWNMLQKSINKQGNPFHIAIREHYGTVNRKSPNCTLCLGFDFLLQKAFFRIGIYVQDDTLTPCFDRLFLQKKTIEEKLGFAPLWTNIGVRNPNTRRIETQLPFIPYDHDDYGRLIDVLIPIIAKYIEVFSIYLPEAFEDRSSRGVHKKSAEKIIVGNSLMRNLTFCYGGSAQPIYDACCERFEWDKSRRFLFGRQQFLYAEGATPEGYSPWFLAHSNLTDTKGGNWSNIIRQSTIEELWETPQYGLYHDETTRIIFAKTKSYGYVFIGVYKPIDVREKTTSDGNKVWIKTYERIADTYPIANTSKSNS